MVHLLCCIDWQIHENEALSCLETDTEKAAKAANKTAVSGDWLKKNRHCPINFEMNWCQYFKRQKKENIIPIEYAKNFRTVKSLIKKRKKETVKTFPSWNFNTEFPTAA